MSIKTDNSQTLVNALAEIERLRGRCAELEEFVADAQQDAWRALDPDYVPPDVESAMKSLLHRAATITQEIDPDDIEPGAWLLRKQADAVEAVAKELEQSDRYGKKEFRRGMATSYGYTTGYAQRLRNQADELESNQ